VSRLLWVGDYFASTGFGRASEAICERLVDYGHEISVLGLNHRGDAKPTRMRKVYMPTMREPKDIYGYSRVVEILGEVSPDVVVLFNDPFILTHYLFRNSFDPDLILLKYRPIITYQTRDGLNGPRSWDTLKEVKVNGEPWQVSQQIAMSKFGQAQMPGSDLAYHGIDSQIFHPVSAQTPVVAFDKRITSKREAKEALGYSSDSFLVLRVDKNSWRKDFASTWKALLPVMKRHTDIVVHFQCSKSDFAGGVQMPELFTRDPETAPRFKLPENFSDYVGWGLNELVTLYNAADLFVTTSMGEGFGLTIAEALASGVPVIAQNLSAIPEVLGLGGMLIEPGYELTAPGGQDVFAAYVPAFTEAIEHLYLNAGFRKRYGKAGMAHVRKTFKWDDAAAVFDKHIRDLHENTELVPVSA
jgi:glycosyltransferase involved in cell wall biosynthesis